LFQDDVFGSFFFVLVFVVFFAIMVGETTSRSFRFGAIPSLGTRIVSILVLGIENHVSCLSSSSLVAFQVPRAMALFFFVVFFFSLE
jgi:hypothetical protein